MAEESAAPLEPQEDESDLTFRAGDLRFDAAIAASDWTTETIVSQLRKGNINLDPSFQRREAWKNPRKSQFIESLILGIPIPQIILAERKERRGSYIVIDGKQRLLTLRQFTATKDDTLFKRFKLSRLLIREDLNGLYYDRLEGHVTSPLSAFDNSTIRTVIIKTWPSEDFLYEVFLRINSGSVQLSPQELRQALHPGEFTTSLNNFSLDSEPLHRILNLDQPDFRMRDNELVLRYVAFRHAVEGYRGNMKGILDEVTILFNGSWDFTSEQVDCYFQDMERSIRATLEIFGEKCAFKKWNGDTYESRINRAVFDVVSYFFSFADVASEAIARKEDVVSAFKELCENDYEFVSAISGTTKSVEAVTTRFRAWQQALQQCLGRGIQFPRH